MEFNLAFKGLILDYYYNYIVIQGIYNHTVHLKQTMFQS